MGKKGKSKRSRPPKASSPAAIDEAIDALSGQHKFKDMIPDLEKGGWGKDTLTKLIDEAFCNVAVSFLKLKPYLELQAKALEVFLDVAKMLSWSTLDGLVSVSLLSRAASCYLAAVRLACSGQMTETWMVLRACLENSLYAFYVSRKPELAEVWMNRHDSTTSKNVCKGHFTIGNMWKALEKESKRTAKEAKKLYEASIDYGGHPNERSLTPNLVKKEDGSGYEMRILNCDESLMQASLITTLMTCSTVFEIFALVFPDEFKQPNLKVKISNLKRQMAPLALDVAKQLKTMY